MRAFRLSLGVPFGLHVMSRHVDPPQLRDKAALQS
jgi:hypothetical protein